MLFENREFETPPRIAKAIGCGAEKIREAIVKGELKAHDFGNSNRPTYRIAKADWEDYLQLKACVSQARAKERLRNRPMVMAKEYV